MNAIEFSVVIPTYNRPDEIGSCLQALSKQTYSRQRFEVIVVDDGGAVPLDPIVKRYRDRLNIRLLEQANAGPASARNRGAVDASGTYVAFIDDDCRPDIRWLEAFGRQFSDEPNRLLGGRTVNALAHNDFSEASQQLITYLYAYFGAEGAGTPFFASNNMAMPQSAFHEIGGFDEAFPLAAGEDREFCDRWNARGLPSEYVPDAVVNHVHEMDFAAFVRQHFNYGRGASHFHRTRQLRKEDPFVVEPLSFYTGLIRYPLTVRTTGRAWLQSALLIVSQAANAAGFFWESAQSRTSRSKTGDSGI